jgi:hypothetical protein
VGYQNRGVGVYAKVHIRKCVLLTLVKKRNPVKKCFFDIMVKIVKIIKIIKMSKNRVKMSKNRVKMSKNRVKIIKTDKNGL